jgi:hypothetical protein
MEYIYYCCSETNHNTTTQTRTTFVCHICATVVDALYCLYVHSRVAQDPNGTRTMTRTVLGVGVVVVIGRCRKHTSAACVNTYTCGCPSHQSPVTVVSFSFSFSFSFFGSSALTSIDETSFSPKNHKSQMTCNKRMIKFLLQIIIFFVVAVGLTNTYVPPNFEKKGKSKTVSINHPNHRKTRSRLLTSFV